MVNKKSVKCFLYIDGASSGNPGPAGVGVVICNEKGKVLKKYGKSIGIATNNEAEYRALIEGLKQAVKLKSQMVEVYTDSELLVNQISGIYKVRSENLKELLNEVKRLMKRFKGFIIMNIPREENRVADRLARKFRKKENN